MNTLTKAELLDTVHEKVGTLTKVDVNRVVAALQETIIETVAGGAKVSLTGFASFEPYTSAERQGRNPRTGETIIIPEKPSVKIKPLKVFKEALGS